MKLAACQYRGYVCRSVILFLMLMLSACATHQRPVALHASSQHTLKVIGLPLFEDQPRIDVRRENPMYAIIGLSARIIQQMVREYHRIAYGNANPALHQYCMKTMRENIKRRLRKHGYEVRDLNMTYWQAQAAFRKKKTALAGVDALLRVQIKRFGYFSASPFKPYRPGMVVTADLITTKERKVLSSNVYNVGYDPKDVPKFDLQIDYMTNIHVADKRFFYRNFDTLIAHARESSQGLKFIASVAAESVAGDMERRSHGMVLARR